MHLDEPDLPASCAFELNQVIPRMYGMSIYTCMVGSDDLFMWVLAGSQQDRLVPSRQADLTGLWRRGRWYSSKPRNLPSPGRHTHIDHEGQAHIIAGVLKTAGMWEFGICRGLPTLKHGCTLSGCQRTS